MLTGELPEVNPEVADRLRSYGHDDFVSYVVWACERALERGLLPHTNLGVLSRRDLGRLREVTASQGLMLESISERLMETVHAGSPTKHPARAAGDDRGRRRAQDPVHERDPGRDRGDRRTSASPRSRRSPPVHRRHGHIQEVILQNFVPHPRYYGREVAEIADAASKERWADGRAASGERRAADLPPWATEITLEDMKHLVATTRELMPDVGIQIPPEPLRLVGRAGRRRGHRPRRAVGQRRPHLARARVPEPASGPQAPAAAGLRADRAPLRLPAVPGARLDGAGGARPGQAQVLELHPAQGLRPARAARSRPRPGARARSSAAATARRSARTS